MSAFTYLYVLVSKPGDTYYEQTLISAISLRYRMPNANIVLLTDNKTAESLNGLRADIKNYVSQTIVVELPDSLTNLQKSRWLKTSIPEYIDTDFLYIDSDTIITQSLAEIECIDVDLGGVLDKHSLLKDHCKRSMISENAKKLGYQVAVDDRHFNGGLMLVRNKECNKKFFRMWHQLWQESVEKGLSIDQAALAQTNYLMKGLIKELPGVWNCQVEYGMHLIKDAKIWHMFVTGDKFNRRPHAFMDPSFYKEIEKNGVSEEILEMIKNPWLGFKNKTQLVGGVAVDYFNSYLSRFCCLLYCQTSKTRRIFSILDAVAKFIMTKKK